MNAVSEIAKETPVKNSPQTLKDLLQTKWFKDIEENFCEYTAYGVKYALRKSRKLLRNDPDNRIVGFFMVDEWGDYSPNKLAENYWEIADFYKSREAFRLCVIQQYLDNPTMTRVTILNAEGEEAGMFVGGVISLANFLSKKLPSARSSGPIKER